MESAQKISKPRMIVFFVLIGLFAALFAGLMIFIAVRHNTLVIASGKCGESLSWQLTESGRLTISGSGRMYDYSGSADDEMHATDAPWVSRQYTITSLRVEEGVTVIGDYAFATCSSLKSVSLPYTLTDMGIYCFAECSSLKKITIPASVDTVGAFAFYGCTALRSLRLEHGIEILGDAAFDNCISLKELNMPSSITAMGSYCFFDCESLKSVELSASLTEVPEACFAKCVSLTDLYIPVGIRKIADRAFNECVALKNISYGGSADQYAAIEIGSSNEGLKNN